MAKLPYIGYAFNRLKTTAFALKQKMITHLIKYACEKQLPKGHCFITSKKIIDLQTALNEGPNGAFSYFFDAYLHRDLLRRKPIIFESLAPKIPAKTFSPMIHEKKLNLPLQERDLCLEACRAVYDHEFVKQHFKPYKKSNLKKWHPIKGSYDIAMVYHHHKKTNTLYIGCRGAANPANESIFVNHDWHHIFACVKHKPKNWGINFKGEIHAGLLKKYSDVQEEFYTSFQQVYTRLSPGEKENLKIIVTGHSFGAALCQLAATDLCINVLPNIYTHFNNAKQNRVWAIAISSPCIGTQKAVDFMHRKIGFHNTLRVNVYGDPITFAGSAHMAKYLRSVIDVDDFPFLKYLLDECDFYPFGHCALQGTKAALRTNMAGVKRVINKNLTQLLIGDYQTALSNIMFQMFAPIHSGKIFEDGIAGFNPEQFKQHDWEDLLI